MRVLVCGGRDYRDRARAYAELDRLPREGLVIITGAANGADSLARDWCFARDGVEIEQYPADWKTYGKAAGPIRNQQMIDEGRPDLVLAFPGGRGTADMVKKAKAANIPVTEVKQ